jgi:hypothetical protein
MEGNLRKQRILICAFLRFAFLTVAVFSLAFLGLEARLEAKSTKLAISWKNPNFSGGTFKNIMVLALNGHASGRAEFEDQMVAAISKLGIQAVPSYSLLPRPDATPIDKDQLRDVVRGQGFDAVTVSRLVKYDKTVTYVPGQSYPLFPYYSTFYGYYGALYPTVYSPGYLQTDTTAQIETNFYSTSKPDGELVWTGTSTTVNPRSVSKAIDAVVKVVVQELQKENII